MRGRGRMIIVIAASLIACLLFYFFFIRSRQADLSEIEAQVETEENTTIQLNTELSRLEELQEAAPELEAELAEFRELVPSDHDTDNFIFLVQEAADQSGVEFVQISPQVPSSAPESPTVAQITTAIAARGGYFAIQDFIRRLYDLDRALRIDQLNLGTIQGEGEGSGITIDVTARIFFQAEAGGPNPNFDPNAPAGEEPVPDPAATPVPGTTPAPVESPAAP